MSESLLIACPSCHALNRVPSERLTDAPTCGRCRSPVFTGKPVALDEAAFRAHVERGQLPVLVDFWAPWCGPCRMMAPHFEQAAAVLEPQVRVAKVDTEGQAALGARFNVRSIPTLALFRNGREVARQPGALTNAQTIAQWARQHAEG